MHLGAPDTDSNHIQATAMRAHDITCTIEFSQDRPASSHNGGAFGFVIITQPPSAAKDPDSAEVDKASVHVSSQHPFVLDWISQ